MSSNIKVTRICQQCGSEFIARTTVTKTCSDKCAKKLYKAKKKAEKIKQSSTETQAIKDKPTEEIKVKEFLTVKELSILLNCSIKTAYKIIEKGKVKAVNISKRKTLIKRSEIDKLFN